MTINKEISLGQLDIQTPKKKVNLIGYNVWENIFSHSLLTLIMTSESFLFSMQSNINCFLNSISHILFKKTIVILWS